MKERPILFSAPMVRAILAGTKTQTRRVVAKAADGSLRPRCPYGYPGDRLWVRETWCAVDDRGCIAPRGTRHIDPNCGDRILYRADNRDAAEVWLPSIFMRRWMSRITLELVAVDQERLHDITEEDARAEGVTPFPKDPEGDCWTDGTHRTAFEFLWGEINGYGPADARRPGTDWASNPWVWAVGFRRVG